MTELYIICKRWHRFSLLFLSGFILCFALNALPIKSAEVLVATQPVADQADLTPQPPSLSGKGEKLPEPLLVGEKLTEKYWVTTHQTSVIASTSSVALVQQGIERYQVGNFTEAIALWQEALAQTKQAKDRAVIHTNLAVAYRQTGKIDRAIASWEQAIQIYAKDGKSDRQIAKLLTEQAQAYSDLGQYRKAIALLQLAIKISDKSTQAAAQGALGNAYWALGDYEQALAAHDASLKISRELQSNNLQSTALNNRGNVYLSRAERYRYQATLARLEGDPQFKELTKLAENDVDAAQSSFQESVEVGGSGSAIQALLNLNRLLERSPSPNLAEIANNRNSALALIEQAPDSRDKAYALINIADSLKRQNSTEEAANRISEFPVWILEKALTIAKNIGDSRAESFALGSLGNLYEVSRGYEKALLLTGEAQLAAQKVNAADSLYRWQWQAGRIYKAINKQSQAIASFKGAIATLQSIRGDIVVANKELQFNFRDDVEPVYRGLMELLLATENQLYGRSIVAEDSKLVAQNNSRNAYPLQKDNSLKTVIGTLESLKLAELQNFFGDDCVQVALNNSQINGAISDTNAAAIYSVILDDRTEMIFQRPNGTMSSYKVEIGKQQLEKEIELLRNLLENRGSEEYLPQAQKVYNLLIRPMEADLAASKLRTLVFINDGVMRQIPMSALHDGKEFLIQKYAIATTPSINLTNSQSQDRRKLKALIMGLTVEKPPFAPLMNVEAEVKAVKQILGGTPLVDNAFTLENLQTQLQQDSYPVVHMATHGKFGVDAENTFLLGYDEQISIEQIDNLLRSRPGKPAVKLLTLSACQTAAGDNRSALGIAGVAVRAGVESALATLWFINDEATVPLIEEFYTQLSQPGITKVEALQKAQLKMIANFDYNHPALWSPFILIGNWL
ncbi:MULTISPECIES: CHAT domain-containing protein [Cyanophyceae]|uniref:CHAT domain-containing protein n=1 Tax=Cyanophyceae TaxID=3028117 RepID=UPI00168A1A79|nr:CHAT domain-containing protein [Trichocoleus sp. FACHB-40]MBD2003122.1 CHAT domain-containing protein [Trichocoleus sp. FACHB-40]